MASKCFCDLRRAQLGTVLLLFFAAVASAQLSANFYASTCPSAVGIIRSGVRSAVRKEARMGASLLRLHFHDCFVNGCDASVLLDDTATFTGEKTALPNINSLRGFDVIDSIKTSLETTCPGVVSCADILAVAARESVTALGGPSWNVVMGRRDSTTASFSAVTQNLIAPTASLSELISGFSSKGFTAKELVALYGAHTIGQARCTTFRDRIYNDANIDATFAATRQANCPLSGGDGNLAPLDAISPNLFDNGWFKDLVANKGLLHSDQQLFSGGSTDAQVTAYSTRPLAFRSDFANGMAKMGNLSPLTGTSGQIRKNCRAVN